MIKVDGFLFEDKEMAQIARREAEGIRYIRQRTTLDNPEAVLKLYKKLLNQDIFVTPIGTCFLLELQNILLDSDVIAGDEIPSIPVKVLEKEKMVEVQKPVEEKKSKESVYRKKFLAATFCAVVLGFSVIGMFAINAISGNNINIINYREQLLNEYSTWESELKAEEERLERWEESLEERENNLNE